MDILRIERAIALLDPAGLICMGAPLEEYSSEAFEIFEVLKNRNFDEDFFLETYLKVMQKSFGNSTFDQLIDGEKDILLDVLLNELDANQEFIVGTTYKVVSRSFGIPELEFHFAGNLFSSGDVVSCVYNDFIPGIGKCIYLLTNGAVICATELSKFSEARARWFFEEVEK